MPRVSIKNSTRRPAPRLPYEAAAHVALPGWEISLAFVGSAQAAKLNRALRGKTYTPNVLSYRAGEKSGEIIICPQIVEKQAPAYGLSPRSFTLLLFIHGLLHLKGMPHGPTMERREQALLRRFGGASAKSYGTTHRNRHRHRHLPSEGGRRRGIR